METTFCARLLLLEGRTLQLSENDVLPDHSSIIMQSFNLKPLLSELNSFRKIFIDCYLLGKKNSNEPVEGMEKNILQSKNTVMYPILIFQLLLKTFISSMKFRLN